MDEQAREAAALDLSEHYTSIQTLSPADIPYPINDSSGFPVLPLDLDFGPLDAALELRPDVQIWLLITGISRRTPGELIDGGTPEDEAAFKEWVTAIRDHLAERGLDKDRWAFFWVDEPSLTEWNDTIVPHPPAIYYIQANRCECLITQLHSISRLEPDLSPFRCGYHHGQGWFLCFHI
ncbi:MAG: hypothetical protein IH988_03985 [Planctomycetes bacterium]|nr:hypothetical protein [Planctomycetota bacterium]